MAKFEQTIHQVIWIANKSMRTYSTLLDFRKMQSKTTMRFHYTVINAIRMVQIYKWTVPSAEKEMEQLELSCIGSGDTKW
jgi:hypothetical protein